MVPAVMVYAVHQGAAEAVLAAAVKSAMAKLVNSAAMAPPVAVFLIVRFAGQADVNHPAIRIFAKPAMAAEIV
jgi:hypothetical protein